MNQCLWINMVHKTGKRKGFTSVSIHPNMSKRLLTGTISYNQTKRSGPKVIKLFSCSTQQSIKFELLINTEIAQIN